MATTTSPPAPARTSRTARAATTRSRPETGHATPSTAAPAQDKVTADRTDAVKNCEYVKRAKAARLRRADPRHYARPMDHRAAGWQLFAQADWAGARDAFAAALSDAPGDPEALDGLGQALWWLGERDAGDRAPARGLRGLPRARRARDAGRLALPRRRVPDRRPRRRVGGLARAGAAPAGRRGAGADHGWLAIEEAKRAGDLADAERHARAALAIAHEIADADIECMALAQLGRALVRQGRVEEGIALLDEAMTVALGGESSDPLACGDACCTTLVVCDGLADLDRATQWCEAVVEFTERRRFVPVQSWCRAIFGAVLVRSGRLGAGRRGARPRRSRGGRTARRAAATRCRSRCSPTCGSSRAAWRRRRGCSRASTTTRPRGRAGPAAPGARRDRARGAPRATASDDAGARLRAEVALARGDLTPRRGRAAAGRAAAARGPRRRGARARGRASPRAATIRRRAGARGRVRRFAALELPVRGRAGAARRSRPRRPPPARRSRSPPPARPATPSSGSARCAMRIAPRRFCGGSASPVARLRAASATGSPRARRRSWADRRRALERRDRGAPRDRAEDRRASREPGAGQARRPQPHRRGRVRARGYGSRAR